MKALLPIHADAPDVHFNGRGTADDQTDRNERMTMAINPKAVTTVLRILPWWWHHAARTNHPRGNPR